MSMNYERVTQGLPAAEAAKYATGIGLVNDLVHSLKGRGLLPEEFAGSEATAPVSVNPLSTSETGSLVAESNNFLDQAIAELQANPFSPEANTHYEIARLRAKGKVIGLEVVVPACNWTEEEIRRPMKDKEGKEVPSMMIYLPDELMGKEGLVNLGKMYPKMRSSSVQEGTTIQDSPDASKKGGWIKVEATVDAPNLNTTQGDLEKHGKKQGYCMQRENVYILAAQKSKDLSGRYLDEGVTWSRLGSRLGSNVVHAGFYSGGDLLVGWYLGPQSHDVGLGGRFEEVKKA